MGERRCVYTVLTGGYEPLLEQHIARQHDTDLICFTDRDLPAGSGWEARPLELVLPADPSRSSRRPKLLPHQHLADYDASLYIDNSVLLTADPAAMFDAYLPSGVGMAAFAHSWRKTLRDEFAEVVTVGKEASWVCAEQLAHYEATDPQVLAQRPIAGGFLFRRHGDPVVQEAMELWWVHVLRYSRRDQLSLPVAVRAAGLQVLVHDVDNHLSPFHEWPRAGNMLRDPAAGTPLPSGPEEVIAGLEADLAAVRHELATARLDEQARTDAAVRVAVERAVAELHASTSWRLTSPLRWLRDRTRAPGDRGTE